MQVHNLDAKQTVFAYNGWTAGENADVGIGNSPAEVQAMSRDWTFNRNASEYELKRLRVFVRTDGGPKVAP